MALTIASGVDGSFTAPTGHNGKFDTWSLNVRQVVNDITGFDSGGFEENIGGLKGADFTATSHFKYDAANTSPGLPTKTGGTATCQVAANCTYSATVIVSATPASSNVRGAAGFALAGRTSGTITLAWDETP
jgi:hypothetical protein